MYGVREDRPDRAYPRIDFRRARDPGWLLEPRKRAERALAQVVVECYVRGVSTRRVDGLVKSMGLHGMSKSQVSALAAELDGVVEEFRNRPLDQGPYTYLWVDALSLKSREGGRIANVAVVVATGVNAEGKREILGLDVFTTEDGAYWRDGKRVYFWGGHENHVSRRGTSDLYAETYPDAALNVQRSIAIGEIVADPATGRIDAQQESTSG